MAEPIHVLIVDDDREFLDRATAAFSHQEGTFEVTTVRNVADVLEALSEARVDCVVSAYDLEVTTGVDLLEELRSRTPELPFVLVTRRRSEQIAADAKAAGATDYLELTGDAQQLEVLAARVETAVVKRRSERARREDQLKLERYRTLVSTVTDPMYMSDAMGNCTMVNEAMVEFTGSDREWLIGQNLGDLVGESLHERAVEELSKVVHDGAEQEEIHLEVTFEQGDGTTRIGEASITPLVDDEGRFQGTAGVVRDISERKERELELSQYETITETAPVGIVVLDEAGRIRWANEQIVGSVTMDLEDVLDAPFAEFVDRGFFEETLVDRYLEVVSHLLSSSNDDEKQVYEITVNTSTGGERIFEVHTALLPLEDGEFQGTINAFRDITRRTAYRWELEHQNDRLERFTSLVSHDLRNPLNVAEGYLDIHEEACESPDDSLDQVHGALDRMQELIEDLLALARSGRAIEDRERVDLRSTAAEAWRSVETGDASLELEVDGVISAHGGRLRELFENLFRNAIEHGGSDVTVTVGRLADADLDAAELRAATAGTEGEASLPGADRLTRSAVGESSTESAIGESSTESAIGGASTESAGSEGAPAGFYVADDGRGLPDDASTDQLLELGFTTSDEGTGLGLGIVAEVAEAHGWTVDAGESEAGGARFSFGDVTVLEDGDD